MFFVKAQYFCIVAILSSQLPSKRSTPSGQYSVRVLVRHRLLTNVQFVRISEKSHIYDGHGNSKKGKFFHAWNLFIQMIFTSNICVSIVHAIHLQFNNTKRFCHRCKRLSGTQFFAFHIALYIYLTPKVFYTEAKSNTKTKFFLWSSSLLNVNIQLNSLWTHLEVISLSLQYNEQ